ncbi:MAG: hypothetical protein RBQ97_12005 [Acholeplasma sp.]|nr:hypothetical protein [Acholeplasma sp.]
MNTRQQAIAISRKIDSLIDPNKGILRLIFFDNSNIKVRFLRMTSNLTVDEFTCKLDTFTNDINNVTTYDIYDIMDVN